MGQNPIKAYKILFEAMSARVFHPFYQVNSEYDPAIMAAA